MVYRPQDPNQEQLYVVKRENEEEYASGHYSSVGPKLYRKGNATAKANSLNKSEDNYRKPYVRSPMPSWWTSPTYGSRTVAEWEEQQDINERYHSKSVAIYSTKGRWIVLPATISCFV